MNCEVLYRWWPQHPAGPWMTDDCVPDLVTVVVPTYNRAYVLREALESVRVQTYRPIEIVVVDDGSTDRTEGVLEAWVSECLGERSLIVRRIRQRHSGAPAARNRGLVESRGAFIQFLDSDDLLHPEKIRRQVTLAKEDSDVDYVYSGVGYFARHPVWDVEPYCCVRPLRKDLPLAAFLKGGTWNTVSGLYRRRACMAIGPWDEDATILQDWDYHVRFLLGEPEFSFVSGTLALQRRGLEDRVTAAHSGRQKPYGTLYGLFYLYRKWLLCISESGRLEADVECALSDPMVEVLKQALLSRHDELATGVEAWLRPLSPSKAWGRRLAVLRLLMRLPAPWRYATAQSLESVRALTRPIRRVLGLVSP